MEWLWHRLRSEEFRLVMCLLLAVYAAFLLWQALVGVDDPIRWIEVVKASVLLAFAAVVLAFRRLRRPIPIFDSGNPYLSAAGWVALLFFLYWANTISAPYQPPPTVWILSGILAYGVTVVVMQIRRQPPQ